MKKHILIVPCATRRTDVEFAYDKEECLINCVRAMSYINLCTIDEVYFVVISDKNDQYRLSQKIIADCTRLDNIDGKVHIINIQKTNTSADTVYTALKRICGDNKADIQLYIKDADNMCYNTMPLDGNEILCGSLEDMSLVDPQHKSYIKLDEQGFITNAIEKRVISDRFIAGGYNFDNANDFIEAYESLKKTTEKFYISDIVFWLILNRDLKFRPVMATKFNDFNI